MKNASPFFLCNSRPWTILSILDPLSILFFLMNIFIYIFSQAVHTCFSLKLMRTKAFFNKNSPESRKFNLWKLFTSTVVRRTRNWAVSLFAYLYQPFIDLLYLLLFLFDFLSPSLFSFWFTLYSLRLRHILSKTNLFQNKKLQKNSLNCKNGRYGSPTRSDASGTTKICSI